MPSPTTHKERQHTLRAPELGSGATANVCSPHQTRAPPSDRLGARLFGPLAHIKNRLKPQPILWTTTSRVTILRTTETNTFCSPAGVDAKQWSVLKQKHNDQPTHFVVSTRRRRRKLLRVSSARALLRIGSAKAILLWLGGSRDLDFWRSGARHGEFWRFHQCLWSTLEVYTDGRGKIPEWDSSKK